MLLGPEDSALLLASDSLNLSPLQLPHEVRG